MHIKMSLYRFLQLNYSSKFNVAKEEFDNRISGKLKKKDSQKGNNCFGVGSVLGE